MRQTKKYTRACDILKFPHQTQEQLYSEMNRLGWWWDSKKQAWERNDSLKSNKASDLIRVRVWADNQRISQIADLIQEGLEGSGFKVQERSEPYINRPPNNNESRIYLTCTYEND
jgi:hypothetical protein